MSTATPASVYKWAINNLFSFIPCHCLLCKTGLSKDPPLCPECNKELPWLTFSCRQCGLPLAQGAARQQVCGNCLSTPPPFQRCVPAFSYTDPVDRLIGLFKYQHRFVYGKLLAALMARSLKAAYTGPTWPDLIIPVPLHRSRLQSRGFNQCLALAAWLSPLLGVPYHWRLCRRILPTPPQQGLKSPQRRRNLKGAFQVSQAAALNAVSSVALLDDVVTTATTVSELSQCLRDQGINDIHIWCVARAY